MVSQAELKKRRVKATKEQTRQEQVVDRRDRRRRLGVSAFILVLALALIAPLAAGLFASLDDDSSTIDTSTPVELDATPPSLVDPGFEGASLTGPTPCPATDGTQQRVTSFEAAPVGCIDPVASYTVDLATIAGSVAIDLDVGGAPEALKDRVPPLEELGYPEPNMFGELPATGFYVRDARNVEMSNIEIAVEKADPRAAFWLRDVEGADFFRLRLPGGAPSFHLTDVRNFRTFGSLTVADRQLDKAASETF